MEALRIPYGSSKPKSVLGQNGFRRSGRFWRNADVRKNNDVAYSMQSERAHFQLLLPTSSSAETSAVNRRSIFACRMTLARPRHDNGRRQNGA
jgi:hypothetical protein